MDAVMNRDIKPSWGKGEKGIFFVLYHPFFCYTVWKYNTGNNGKTSILMAAVIRVAELQSYAEL